MLGTHQVTSVDDLNEVFDAYFDYFRTGCERVFCILLIWCIWLKHYWQYMWSYWVLMHWLSFNRIVVTPMSIYSFFIFFNIISLVSFSMITIPEEAEKRWGGAVEHRFQILAATSFPGSNHSSLTFLHVRDRTLLELQIPHNSWYWTQSGFVIWTVQSRNRWKLKSWRWEDTERRWLQISYPLHVLMRPHRHLYQSAGRSHDRKAATWGKSRGGLRRSCCFWSLEVYHGAAPIIWQHKRNRLGHLCHQSRVV